MNVTICRKLQSKQHLTKVFQNVSKMVFLRRLKQGKLKKKRKRRIERRKRRGKSGKIRQNNFR